VAFPTTGILDDFNRANEGPPPSANWTGPWRTANLLVVNTNQLARSGGNADAYWNPTTFGPNMEAFATLPVLPVVGAAILGGRLQSPGAGTTDGYATSWSPASSGSLVFYRSDNAALTQLGATVTSTSVSAGDQIGMSVVGSVISWYLNGSLVDTRSDATYSGAGYIGAGCNDATLRMDNFGGGTAVSLRFTNTLGIRSPIRYDL